uniref:TFIIB-type domain-containing protein n=1 Tax=Syphacia muris TaxID=451379 RepID=A0A0N5ANP5_9BILA
MFASRLLQYSAVLMAWILDTLEGWTAFCVISGRATETEKLMAVFVPKYAFKVAKIVTHKVFENANFSSVSRPFSSSAMHNLDTFVKSIKDSLIGRSEESSSNVSTGSDSTNTSKDDNVEITSHQSLSKRLSRTEIMSMLSSVGIDVELTPFTGLIRVKCINCGSNHGFISHLDDNFVCINCGYTCAVEEYQSKARDLHLPALSPHCLDTVDSVVRYDYTSKRWKFKRKMDAKYRIDDMDLAFKGTSLDEQFISTFQLDSDIYDRVSYLNLMSQYEEKERKRKQNELETFRRLREE